MLLFMFKTLENGGEVGFFIKFDNQKRTNVVYSPLSTISCGCVHWGIQDTRFYGSKPKLS